MDVWIVLAVTAAFVQNLRSMLQKHIVGELSTLGAAYVRFCYALPFSLFYLYWLNQLADKPLPQTNPAFWGYCLLGSFCQAAFTVQLLRIFSYHSFAVGTTFSKLEVIMVAGLGALLLGDTLRPLAVLAILLSTVGVVALSLGKNRLSFAALRAGLMTKSTLLGLLCAAWLGCSVTFFRAATLRLSHPDFVMAAAFTLAVALLIQTVVMALYLRKKEPGELTRVAVNWRPASMVGLTGGVSSVGWFTAFAIQNASYVRAVGQIELVFAFVATTLFFKEKVSRVETIGIVLVSLGIVLLLLVT